MMNLLFKAYYKTIRYFRGVRLITLLSRMDFKEMNDLMETVYPGFKAHLSAMYDRHNLHAMRYGMDFIKANGGVVKLADYYNSLDEQGKKDFQETVLKTFGQDDAFENLVVFLDNASKTKDYGTLGLLLCDLKDGIIESSIKAGHRTMKDWRRFLRHEHECGNDITLGILDEIENNKKEDDTESTSQNKPSPTIPDFPADLIDRLYEYNDVVFKHISSLTEFRHIILRLTHTERLVECSGRKTHLYNILWRLHKLPPAKEHSQWLEDVCRECGFNPVTVSKKYRDSSTMKEDNRRLLEELDSLFDKQQTRRH